MKKIILVISAMALCATMSFAQSFESATQKATDANNALMAGDTQTAVDSFKAAMEEAAQCTEEGAAELIENCKKGIVSAYYNAANSLISENRLDEAIESLKNTIASAQEYADEEMAAKADEKKTQVHQQIANLSMKAAQSAADASAKAEAYKKALANIEEVIAADAENAKAVFQKGQILSSLGKTEEAAEAIIVAKEKGMADQADKQLSNLYTKVANAAYKAGNFKECIAAADKANSYLENANAYKIAGNAAYKAKDFKTAVANLSKYLELSPNAKDAETMQKVIDFCKAQK